MASIYDMAMGTLDSYAQGQQTGRQNRLRDLMGQAVSGPRENRKALLGHAAQVDPMASLKFGQALREDDGDRMGQVAKIASLIDSAPEDQKATIYAQVAPEMNALGIPVPQQWDASFAPHIRQIAQAYAGAQSNNTVQSRFVGEDGQVYALMRDGNVQPLGIKADPSMQIIEGAGGFYGVNRRNLEANPVQVGQPGVQQRQQQPQMQYTTEDGQPIPAGEQDELAAAIRASAAGKDFTIPVRNDGDLSRIPPLSSFTGGAQLQAAPKAAGQPSDIERRLEMARQMGATPEELKRMVVGGESGRDAQRISTADATKARQKLTQIQSARQQLAAAKQAFQKLRGSFSAGIGGNYLPTPEGQAFDRAIRNLSPLITAVTRVPGVGSMSDYEGKLAEQALPSRGTYEEVTEQQIADLERLLDSIEGGYNDLLGKPAAPAVNQGWSIQKLGD